MSKIRLERAKHYIQERDYRKAREILWTMPDNSIAQKWLTKLDKIDPPSAETARASFTGYSPEKVKRKTSSQARKDGFNRRLIGRRSWQIVGSILSVIGVAIMAFMLIRKPLLQPIVIPAASSNGFGMPMTYGYMYFDPLLEAHCVTGLILAIGLALLYAGLYLIQHPEREPDHF